MPPLSRTLPQPQKPSQNKKIKCRQSGKPDSVTRRHDHLSSAINPELKWSGPLLVPYLILLRTGFTLPPRLPLERWALTPPFHPYPNESRRFVFCGTFHHRRYRTDVPACSTERPALRSPDFPPSRRRAADTLCLQRGKIRYAALLDDKKSVRIRER